MLGMQNGDAVCATARTWHKTTNAVIDNGVADGWPAANLWKSETITNDSGAEKYVSVYADFYGPWSRLEAHVVLNPGTKSPTDLTVDDMANYYPYGNGEPTSNTLKFFVPAGAQYYVALYVPNTSVDGNPVGPRSFRKEGGVQWLEYY